jgi:2-polyprenyl-3-methyl-5-hydroxy-6-metoxy-1,4-benzoquinol methylase
MTTATDARSTAAEACPVCGEAATQPFVIVGRDRLEGTPGEFTVVTCASCGAGRTLPAVTTPELGRFYTRTYRAHALHEGGLYERLREAGQRLRWRGELRRFPLAALAGAPGSVLDIGCGHGDLGAALVARGWQVTGVDPSAQAVEHARARGIDARVGTIDDAGLGTASFDVVTMLHSLEHVVSPVDDLRAARARLRPGGVLVVVLPNYGSWQRKRMGSRWFHLDLPRHRTHFTRAALRRAAERAGFVGVQVEDAADPGALIGTLQYRLFDRLVLASGWRAALWQAAATVLAPASGLLDRAAGERDLLCMTARRPAA